jgi:hypothetical protein
VERGKNCKETEEIFGSDGKMFFTLMMIIVDRVYNYEDPSNVLPSSSLSLSLSPFFQSHA